MPSPAPTPDAEPLERVPAPLPSALLRRAADLDGLAFETTADLEPSRRLPGQERAAEALELALGIADGGYNAYVMGPEGGGRHTFARRALESAAAETAVPSDVCYVHDFAAPDRPALLRPRAGTGRRLAEDMAQLVKELGSTLQAVFEGEDFHTRRQMLQEELKEQQAEALEAVREAARGKDLAMVGTPMGLVFAPLRDGKVVEPDAFKALPEAEKERIKADIEQMQVALQKVFRQAPRWEREVRKRMRELEQEMTAFAVGHLIDDLRATYAEHAEVLRFLDAVRDDLVEHGRELLEAGEQAAQGGPMAAMAGAGVESALRRYQVNVLVDHGSAEGAPVVYEDHPSFDRLVGRIEHRARFGALETDFSLIKPGALHRAAGGYLLVDAARLLREPAAWEALKRSLQSRQVRIESLARTLGLSGTSTLEPEPMPLALKVVIVGERRLYYLLVQLDPDFDGLFKIAADFEDILPRAPGGDHDYARLLAGIARSAGLPPCDRGAVAQLIEAGARDAGDAERLSLDVERAEERLREAAWQARRRAGEGDGTAVGEPASDPATGSARSSAAGLVITAGDVSAAIEARERRFGRIRERSQEMLLREHIEVATEGSVVGQVNGLAVLKLGASAFGRPSRISARVGLGKGEVVDIEREAQLGGPLHTKGVLILSGFLKGRFAAERPLSLAASLVFEQSYGGVDGDSASSAELYALLSALAELPLYQGRAVTGAVGQRGEVLAIGGVNHKIEGFFDLCAARGLTGEQGVLIPHANRDHLMLRPDVVAAVAEGRFHIWPVRHVDQGIELLTGVAAGRRDESGDWPAGSVNGRVAARLAAFLERQVALARQQRGVGSAPNAGAQIAEPATDRPATDPDAAHDRSASDGARS